MDISSTFVWQDHHYAIPFGVMYSRAIRSQQGELVNFEIGSFNQFAVLDLPALQNWYQGATFWELFREDARHGLFMTYKHVYTSDTAQEDMYFSPTTGKEYYSLLKPWHDGVLAVGLALDRLDHLDQEDTPVMQPQLTSLSAPVYTPPAQPGLTINYLAQQINTCQRVVSSYCQTLFNA